MTRDEIKTSLGFEDFDDKEKADLEAIFDGIEDGTFNIGPANILRTEWPALSLDDDDILEKISLMLSIMTTNRMDSYEG